MSDRKGYPPHSDLVFLGEAVGHLKTYLISDVLFWPLGYVGGGEDVYSPQELTLGNVLLSRARLKAARLAHLLDDSQKSGFASWEGEIERLHQHWRRAWENKAQREFQARIRQWGFFLDELARNPELHGPFFQGEVRNRVLLELLLDQLPPQVESLQATLKQQDARLAGHLERGEFIWDKDLMEGFPEDRYWFMYRVLRTQARREKPTRPGIPAN